MLSPQYSAKMEGSQFLESAGSEEERPIDVDDERSELVAQILHCAEPFTDFPDEQEWEPQSPEPQRKQKARNPPQAPKKGRRTVRVEDPESEEPAVSVRVGHAAVGEKRPRAPPVLEEEEEEDERVPDLLAYLNRFQLPELEMVKMLRACANYLSAKDPRNRVRYSDQSAKNGQWTKRWN